MVSLLPTDFHVFTGLSVPDPVTFVVGEQWCNRPRIYPRQATLLKIVFLRTDLLTDYDHGVLDEWEESFRRTENEGITPGIRERAEFLRDLGYTHFREVLLVLGRRGGKGYFSALCMAYVLWMDYLSKGDPQEFYQIDRDKQLACFIYAGKKDQAKKNLWSDLNNVIIGAPAFEPYIARPLAESLTLYAPSDFLKLEELKRRRITTTKDQATFLIEPKEATTMSGRGPASCILGFDEFAHLAATGATRSADEVWNAATPSLDQFKKSAFIIEPSSPWSQVGQFYQNWEQSLSKDDQGHPEYPSKMMIQLPSWAIYEDWEAAAHLPLLPRGFQGDLGEYVSAPPPKFQPLKLAIQEYDDEMVKLEKANPDMFKVERRAHWQTTLDAYLNPDHVDAMFDSTLSMTNQGKLAVFYKGHADPSMVNANFAVAIGHAEPGENGLLRCVFDFVHHWSPADFPNNTIDYIEIEKQLWDLIYGFKCDEFTFDQYQSQGFIQQLNYRIQKASPPKRMTVWEQTATAAHNWERAENFKVALNQGWISCPPYEQLRQELKFLRLITTATTNRVDKQETGPIVTKDTADCAFEVVWTVLGDQVHSFTHGALSEFRLRAGLQGGIDPHGREVSMQDSQTFDQLGGLSSRQRNSLMRGGGLNPARNSYRRRR